MAIATVPGIAPAPRKAPVARVIATFKNVRETKGSVVFEENAVPGGHRKVRTLYLRKEAFEELGSPAALTVTIAAVTAVAVPVESLPTE